jgi:hypothetical protein
MSTHLFASTVLMVLVLAGTYLGIARLDRRQRSEATDLPARRSGAAAGRVAKAADDPAELGAGFVVVALLVGALSVAAMGGSTIPLPGTFGLIVGLLGVLLVGFLFLGSYVVVRQHGLGQAQGIAVGLFGVGGVGILLVAANLVFEFV